MLQTQVVVAVGVVFDGPGAAELKVFTSVVDVGSIGGAAMSKTPMPSGGRRVDALMVVRVVVVD